LCVTLVYAWKDTKEKITRVALGAENMLQYISMELEHVKKLLTQLGFASKEGTGEILRKEYGKKSGGYILEVDTAKQTINYGNKIRCGSKRTQNFSHDENFVVLECVDRLLTKGYKPEDIELEKVYPSGHGHSGELDICVNREDGKEYLLIECKTFGKEFEGCA
jgi:type I restriction enzyme M protein